MIRIETLDVYNLTDAGRCDGLFSVDGRLVLSAEADLLRYTVVSVEPYEKRYPAEPIDYTAWIGNPERAIFLAYLDGQVAGEMRILRYWNRYAYIDDLVVDLPLRRRGVGRALLDRARQWAQEQGLAGVMLETQNNNLVACRLYAACGFELAGFDRLLYRGLHPGTAEVALYWYWTPGEASAG